MVIACDIYVRNEKCTQNFDQNTKGIRPNEISRHRWADNIIMALEKVVC
jgi:hypothetical protein